ncbi:MAG: adenylate kinase family protein [Candidatus Poseidoniaceae archaeon]|nr:adenylate kinase family protein [Candidatus Poseidoniaceae archaeon]
MSAIRIALTGTPASGKTSVAQKLSSSQTSDSVFSTIHTVRKLAQLHDCLGIYDEHDDAVEIDIGKLATKLLAKWDAAPTDNTIIDGHLAHHLPVDAIVILRTNPDVLAVRLQQRGYPDEKIGQNVEWEMLAGVWAEITENGVPILELDTTVADSTKVAKAIEAWILNGLQPAMPVNRIDWLAKDL